MTDSEIDAILKAREQQVSRPLIENYEILINDLKVNQWMPFTEV